MPPDCRARATRSGRRPGTSTTTATSICSSPASRAIGCIAIAVTAGSTTSRRQRASPAASSPSPAAGSTTTTTAASISSSSTTCSGRRTRTLLRRRGPPDLHLLPPAHVPGTAEPPLPQSRRPHVRGCRRGPACEPHVGKGMSASFADFDHDGRLDIFITNDAVPNFLFRNNGDGTFTETALLAGCRCRTRAGRLPAWASMRRTTTTTAGRTSSSRR